MSSPREKYIVNMWPRRGGKNNFTVSLCPYIVISGNFNTRDRYKWGMNQCDWCYGFQSEIGNGA